MVLEERKCPNCGSGDIIEKDGTYVCMSCRTFFDNPNNIKITNVQIKRNETEIERIKAKERKREAEEKAHKRDLIIVLVIVGLAALYWIIFMIDLRSQF